MAEPAEKDSLELTDLDREIIDYAVRKWRKSSKAAEFHMLLREARVVDKGLIVEFLRLWLY